MKLLFLCGSLEPGRDGVGDYTRRLAGECTSRDHVCTLLALHDPHVVSATDHTEDEVRVLRLPAADPWDCRLDAAETHLKRLAPDWVSWQFVAQSFQPRVFLPSDLLFHAHRLRGTRSHLMLHEFWLGLERGSGTRDRALGWLQRRGVLCLLEQLDPDCLHTSNTTYQHALLHQDYDAEVLALFGNVPIAEDFPSEEPPLAPWLPGMKSPFVALTFGTLHPQWQPAATVDWLLDTAHRLARPPALLAIGRAGPKAASILAEFRGQGVAVVETGELAAPAVSRLLAAADCGIAPHPWALLGKSGAASAMLEHGLPVLVPRDDWRLRQGSLAPFAAEDPLLVRLAGLDADATDRWLAARRPPASALPGVADTFLRALATTPASL